MQSTPDNNVEPNVRVRIVNDLASVIRRAQRLEPSAFETLVDAYSARLYGYLYRLTGRPEDAEDLVQEVFVRLVRMIPQYEHDGRFEAWLFRIATNLARDRIRRLSRVSKAVPLDRVEHEPGDSSGMERLADLSDPGSEVTLELSEEVDRLQGCLARLSQPEREVILLRHYSGMAFAEIAEAMGTPLGTALARAHRGLAKLRNWMESSE